MPWHSACPAFPVSITEVNGASRPAKEDSDPALRPCFDKPEWNGLCDWISRLAEAKKHSEALNYGAFRSVLLTNKQCIFEKVRHERVMVAINTDGADFMAHFDAGCGTAVDLITGET